MTPSGAPRNKHNVCSYSRLPKLYQNALKRAITWISPYEPQLAHSNGLPKPPGYNLEWSRVTLIQVALITGPPAKASHHEHHLKLCRNLSSHITTEQKPSGAHLTSLGGIWVQTAWRASHTARRHTPTESSLHRHRRVDSALPPGASRCHRLVHPSRAARRHCTLRVSVAPFRLAEPSLPPGALLALRPLSQVCVPSTWRLAHAAKCHTSSTMLLVSWHLNRSQWTSNHTTHQVITPVWFSSHTTITTLQYAHLALPPNQLLSRSYALLYLLL